MPSASEIKAQLLAEQELRLAQEHAKQEACLQHEEEEFTHQMAELEMKCYDFSHVLYFSLTLFFFFLSIASP